MMTSTFKQDKEGYLVELADWTPEVADILAREAGMTLTAQHWEAINLLRQFYLQFDHAPNNRVLVKYCALHLGSEKGSSTYLMGLFGGTPAKTAARIAGLPRPTHCL